MIILHFVQPKRFTTTISSWNGEGIKNNLKDENYEGVIF